MSCGDSKYRLIPRRQRDNDHCTVDQNLSGNTPCIGLEWYKSQVRTRARRYHVFCYLDRVM
jgi:hypothetical protein